LDERAIPVIVLAFNFLLGLFGFFFSGGGGISPVITLWILVTGFCGVLVAGMAYENAKKIDFIEEYLLRHIKKLERSEKMMENLIEELDGRIKKFEEKEKVSKEHLTSNNTF
jgi:predicted small metal-binding protein